MPLLIHYRPVGVVMTAVAYTVLIVEDDRLIRRGLREHNPWHEWGFTCVGEAGNGIQALSAFDRIGPDVVITDVRMPVMDGIELIRKIRARGGVCRIVIISGHADFSYAQEGIRYGVTAYLLKPIKQQELKEAFIHLRDDLDASSVARAIRKGEVVHSLEPVLRYIEEHHACDLRIEELAGIANLSVSQLTRLFKSETGHGIVSYINAVRVSQAKLLLDTTDLKIFEIAHRTGFNSVSYFCRVFKESAGHSPNDYRKKGSETE